MGVSSTVAGAPWREIETRLAHTGLHQPWLDAVDRMAGALAEDVANAVARRGSAGVRDALTLAETLDRYPHRDSTAELGRLLDAVACADPTALDDWLIEDRLVNASVALRASLAAPLLRRLAERRQTTTLLVRLAHDDALPVLGAVAAAIEDYAADAREQALALVKRLASSWKPRTRETAATALETLAAARDPEALRILSTLADDRVPAVAQTARKYLRTGSGG